MSLLAKRIEHVTESDLESLLSSGVPESSVLDYKQQTIGSSDKDRHEFLADVSSFANSNGGEIVFGIAEASGLPTQICGVNIQNCDQEILRLEQMIRTGVRAPINGIQTRSISLKSSKFVILMRIPKSWAAPHQIGQQGNFRFFGRGSNGKYQLDVDSLRTLFRHGPDLAERIRLFRAERLGKIVSSDLPAIMPEGSKIVLHFVPIDNFLTKAPIDFRPIRQDHATLTSLLETGGSVRVNLEGYVAVSRRSDGTHGAYVQLFRDGTLEIVEFVEPWEVNGRSFLPGKAFDETLQRMISGMKQTYGAINVAPPIAAMLSLLNMEDRFMGASSPHGYEPYHRFQRKEIICPDIIIEDLGEDSTKIAFPLTNLAWNASGRVQSVFYDNNGNWKG
jgi:hypothetical protein